MKTNIFIKQLAIGLGLSAAMVGTASAATMITAFDYTQEFEWVEPINPPGVVKEGATAGVSDVDGYTKLSWGNPLNDFNLPSSLVINPTAGDSTTPSNELTSGSGADALMVSTDVDATTFALGPVVTHNNFVITDPNNQSLENTTAQDYVVLTPVGGGSDQIQEVTFDVDFTETTNNPGDPGACPAGVPFNGSGCGDIFALSGDLLGLANSQVFNQGTADQKLGFLIDSFAVDGFTYDVYIAATGLGPLSAEACTVASAGDNCIGFTTAENMENSFQLEFAILASENIPEPATLGLLAASLLMMGLVRRRKVNGSLSA